MKLWTVLLCLLLTSCGYNWGHGNRSLPGGHKTVFVELFKNNSKEVGAEVSFTQALTHELERSGFLVVTNKERAEVVLQGTILGVSNTDFGSSYQFYSVNSNTKAVTPYNASLFTSFNMSVVTSLKAIRSRDKQPIWQTTLSGERNYRGSELTKQGIRSSNVLYNQSRRKQTMKLIAQDMMREAFDRLTENF